MTYVYVVFVTERDILSGEDHTSICTVFRTEDRARRFVKLMDNKIGNYWYEKHEVVDLAGE